MKLNICDQCKKPRMTTKYKGKNVCVDCLAYLKWRDEEKKRK